MFHCLPHLLRPCANIIPTPVEDTNLHILDVGIEVG